MAITFRLPTFQTPVEVWKLQPDRASWVQNEEDLVGQIYTQKRTPDDPDSGCTYLVYAKEDDVLRDHIDYGGIANSDVVVISFPTGAARRVGYKVTCVEPRWLKFGNEHLMASLKKLTPAELTGVETDNPPPPPPPFWTNSMIYHTPHEQVADGTSFTTVYVSLRDSSDDPIQNQDVTFLSTGSVVLADATRTTDYWGMASTTATNTVAEETEFRVDVAGFGLLPMFNPMPWTEPTEPPEEPDPDMSSIETFDTPLAVDGTARIVITMRDASGNPVPGRLVAPIGVPFGTYVLIPNSQLTTDAMGVAEWDVTDSVAETVTFTAHDYTSNFDVTGTADVTWT